MCLKHKNNAGYKDCPECLAEQAKPKCEHGAWLGSCFDCAKQQSALAVQIGGDHYKSCKIQPIEYIEANALGFLEGNVLKRVTRHNKPTGKGRQDVEKAIHELQLLLELRYPKASEGA